MQLPLLTLPRAVPMQSGRATQDTIPPTKEQRERVRTLSQRYVAKEKPTIPLSATELRDHASKLVQRHGLDAKFADYVGVVLNSEANREAIASVPFERRLLL